MTESVFTDVRQKLTAATSAYGDEFTHAECLALYNVIEAALVLDKTWRKHGFTHNHLPDALVLHNALRQMTEAAPNGR